MQMETTTTKNWGSNTYIRQNRLSNKGYKRQRRTWQFHFSAALRTIAKIWKQPKCPLREEGVKKRYVYTMEYYSAIKKHKILPFVTT